MVIICQVPRVKVIVRKFVVRLYNLFVNLYTELKHLSQVPSHISYRLIIVRIRTFIVKSNMYN